MRYHSPNAACNFFVGALASENTRTSQHLLPHAQTSAFTPARSLLPGTPPLELPLSLRELNLASNEIESLRLMPDELPTLRNIDVSVNKVRQSNRAGRSRASMLGTGHPRFVAVSLLRWQRPHVSVQDLLASWSLLALEHSM
eukprot:6178483-Pleurochrysis_carterae.AAC.2